MKYSHSVNTALLLNRLALGLMFVLAGIRKLLPGENQSMLDAMNATAEMIAGMAPLPRAVGLAYGYALPWVEITAGLLLMVGVYSRTAAIIIGLMLLSFMIEFGVNWWPAKGPAFDKNLILFTLAILLAATGPGLYRLARRKAG